jgi:sucrose phosphorylase
VTSFRNAPQLITYPDSLGGSLGTLANLLDGPLSGCFGGVHLLPPFPSSGDRGFAPIDYRAIDARFGTWDDLGRIGASHDLALDLIVNHVSRRSAEFRDFEQRGRQSRFADLFLTLDKVWPGGEPDPADLALVFRRRERPYSEFAIEDTGEVERVWTTFGADDPSEQIDIDVSSPIARRMLAAQLAFFAERGVRLVRLDAVGYAIKRAGTSCFMVEPEIHEFMAWLRTVADPLGLELLTEVHGDVAMQRRLADGYWSYDFALPGLLLHAVLAGTTQWLLPHLRAAPARLITTLDSHDGIPIQPDLDGALPLDQAQVVVDACLAAGGNVSRVFTRDGLPDPAFDAHQANCTWYAASGRDDEAYLMARAIQLFSPGIPQVYYVGLLAGDNDPAAIQATGDGRAVNRHDYPSGEISAALERPVVRRLLNLLRLRRDHPAFAGSLEIGGEGSNLSLAWRSGDAHCVLEADLAAGTWAISGADG